MNTENRIKKLNAALDQVVTAIVAIESELKTLWEQELFVRGQLTERVRRRPYSVVLLEFDLLEEREEMTLPVFEVENGLSNALENRGKGFFGEDEGTMIEQRQKVYEREAQKKVDYIDEAAD